MKVLIVEDNFLVAMMIGDELRDAGHEVIGPAADSETGFRLAESEGCECAIVDIDLSDGRTGPELARRIAERLDVPVVFATGQRELALDNLDAALGLLLKPIEPEALLQTIEAIRKVRRGQEPRWPDQFVSFDSGIVSAPCH